MTRLQSLEHAENDRVDVAVDGEDTRVLEPFKDSRRVFQGRDEEDEGAIVDEKVRKVAKGSMAENVVLVVDVLGVSRWGNGQKHVSLLVHSVSICG